ncbi:MAG: ATP-grasp fold amidoligase family protein [Alphaproteobacteria bacterium]|nr:ATP-grasp fold amidoligase family protein [Alphaproteobacteria bacterium]
MSFIRELIRKTFRGIVDHLPDLPAVQLLFLRNFGHFINMKAPQTFNEKINWRKIYQRDPRFPVFADKIAVKDEIARIAGEQYVIPTLWTGESPKDIPFDELPPPYVIKVNHSAGKNIFIRDRKEIAKEEIYASLDYQLSFSHADFFREWGYRNIPHRILIEKMLEMPDGSVPEDYKFFVYNGRAHFIQVSFRPEGKIFLSYYDREWNRLPAQLGHYPECETVEKPKNLDRMIQVAEKIGKDFDFIRVDLYQIGDAIYFGETTFYPNGGVVPFTPDSFDKDLGAPWIINRRL